MNVRKQSAWGVWWLSLITLGIYYLVWHHRINKELAAVTGTEVPANGKWWSQIIPFLNLYGLAKTAGRLNASVGSPTRVGSFTTWFWGLIWFWSQTRYLQRRINTLHDVIAATASSPTTVAPAAPETSGAPA